MFFENIFNPSSQISPEQIDFFLNSEIEKINTEMKEKNIPEIDLNNCIKEVLN